MVDPKVSGYGWFIKLPDGSVVETATDSEAIELLEQDEG